MTENKMPTRPGWYWAKWKIAAEGTREGDELTPSDEWEIVHVQENCIDPTDPEYLAVAVCGVEKTQWPDCFFWGPLLANEGHKP